MRLGTVARWGATAGTYVVAAAAGCLLLAPHPAMAAQCAQPGAAASVSVEVEEGRVAIDNSKHRHQLSQIRSRTEGGGDAFRESAGWQSAGLTVSHTGYRLSVRVEATDWGKGRVCARLTTVDLDVGLHKLDVYVARRYAPDTCAYRTVLAHEYQHVAIFRNELRRHVPSMQRRLIRSAAGLAPVVSATPEAAAAHFQRQLQVALEPVFRQMTRAADHANGRLDTADHYRLEQARCSDW